MADILLLTCSLHGPTDLFVSVHLTLPVFTLPWTPMGNSYHSFFYDFLELLPHLVCHAPWSTPVLSWLLGTSQDKGTTWNQGL
jgi:hypothetical protein